MIGTVGEVQYPEMNTKMPTDQLTSFAADQCARRKGCEMSGGERGKKNVADNYVKVFII